MELSTQTSSNYNDPAIAQQAANMTKAIFQHESGTDYNAVGDNGTSHGAGQWQGGTWSAMAQDVLGDSKAPMSQSNQSVVAQGTLRKWVTPTAQGGLGLNAAEAAAKWNSGSSDNWQNKVGTTNINGKDISYNVPKYVKSVTDLYQQYKSQGQSRLPQGQENLAQTAGEKGSFLNDVGDTLSNSLKGVGNAVSQGFSGKINPASAILQGTGAVVGGVGGLTNNVATHLPVVGGAVQGAENLLGQGIGAVAQTAPGRAVVGAGQQFAQAHPELAGDISAAGNIAGLAGGLFGGGEAAIAAKEGLGAAAAKGLLGDTVKQASERSATSDALAMLSPEKETLATTKQAIKQGRIKVGGGISGQITTDPAQKLVDTADVLGKNHLVKDTASETAQAAHNELVNTAAGLKKQLGSMEITPIVSQDELLNLRAQAMQQIGENPTMVGNAEESAKRIFTKFQSLLPQTSDVTALDVLNARQKLDAWIQSLKGSNVFDPSTENAMSIALRSIRQGANDLIASKAPGVGVKDALAKQSSLYDAMDYLAPKVKKEVGSTRIKRFGKRHPVTSGLVKTALRGAVLGTGISGAEHLLP